MRSPNRKHDRQSFFKYMSAATARAVLTSRTLRWSSPVLFNDPFDVPRELSFGLTPSDIVEALSARMADLIENPPDDTSELTPGVRLIVDTVKRGIPSQLRAELLDGLKERAASHRPAGESMESLRAMWRTTIPEFRILCLTESPDHVAMWYHYADRYKGVVLEFGCDDRLDSAWLMAQQVEYSSVKPDVYTAAGWANLLTLRQDLAVRKILNSATFTKSSDWSYEREWRITSFRRPTDTGPFTDYQFFPEELVGIFLGPMIAPEDMRAITSLSAWFPRTRSWKVSIGMSRELQFDPVG